MFELYIVTMHIHYTVFVGSKTHLKKKKYLDFLEQRTHGRKWDKAEKHTLQNSSSYSVTPAYRVRDVVSAPIEGTPFS